MMNSQAQKLKMLPDGTVIADRYRIEGFIAAGTHGQVYKALDLELEQTIALKLLHPGLAKSSTMVARFKNELLIARKITHKNVCRVFDVCKSVVLLGAEHVEIVFITMELVQGRTLADYLECETKPFDQCRSIDIIRQVIAGLDEAHQHQFIHGDVKASNIILSEEPNGSLRAVITDFGLSHASHPGELATAATRMQGTPLYMAPEQISGEPLSPATDVFSLGVLIYRMLMGQWPFQEQTALLTALKRLYTSPTDVNRLSKTVGKQTAGAILRCLQRDPQKRFQNLKLLDHILAVSRSRQTNTAGLWLVTAMLVVLAGSGLWYLYNQTEAEQTPESTGLQQRPTIAVLPLINKTGRAELDWLGTSVQKSAISKLQAVDALRSISAENISRLVLQAPMADTLIQQQWVAITSGADWFVVGNYQLDTAASTSWHIRLVAVTDGSTLFETRFSMSEAELNQTGFKLTDELLAHLQIETDRTRVLGADQPISIVALSNYSQGLDLLYQFKPDEALDYFYQALAQEPDNAVIESALAETQLKLGMLAESKQTLERAQRHGQNLNRRERLSLDARLHLAERNFERAAEIYRALREFFPDELEFGLSLATALASDGKLALAFETLNDLRELPAELGNDVRIDLLEAELAATHSEFEVARIAAQTALEKGSRSETPLVIAGALRWQARVLYYADSESLKAIEALRNAREIYMTLGITRSVADVATELADLSRHQADAELSAQLYDEALQASESIGDTELRGRIMNGRADLISGLGQYADALAIYQQILQEQQNVKRSGMLGLMHHNIGTTAVKLGDLDLGWEHLSQAKQIYQDANDRYGMMLVNYAMGSFWKTKGELKPASISFKEALSLAEAIDSQSWAAYARLEIGDIARRQGDYDTAVATATAAFNTFLQRGEEVRAARVGISLGGFLIYAGDYETAGEVAGQSLLLIEKHQINHAIGQVHSVLAHVHAHFGELVQLKIHLEKATEALSLMGQVEHRLLLQDSLAMIGYDAGVYETDYVRAQLQQVYREAEPAGLMLPLLRSQFNLAKVANDEGGLLQSDLTLHQVYTQAQELGFTRLADKANTLIENINGKTDF